MEKAKLGRAGLLMVLGGVAASVTLVWLCWVGSPAYASIPAEATQEETGQRTQRVNGVEYPVNENGQTYGEAGLKDGEDVPEACPDLISVYIDVDTGNEFIGYMEKDVYFSVPDIANPEEAVSWMEAGQPTDPVALYAKDGVTQVGWWVGENGKWSGRSL